MALSNKFNQLSLYGGGSTPTWKRLGYSSQAEYINALTGADGKKKIPTTLEEAYGSNSAIQLSPQDRLGNFDQDVVAKVWNGGGSGGVTDEGVVIGNPNVEKFPTIKNSSSGKTSTDTLASMKETTPTATGGGSVPAGNDGTSAGTGGAATATGSNEFGAKYQGNDFLGWYRANYGADYDPSQGFSRGQGMSDVDWAIGNSLYGTYLTGQTLDKYYNLGKEQVEQNYGQSIESLDTSRRNSQQAASITLDKLKKYLPAQIKSQGLGGLGVSESSMLQAYTDYNNRMGDIESDYNATKSTLEANRNATLADLESNYLRETGDLQTGALKDTLDIFNQYLSDYKTEQTELYNQALYALESSGYSTEEELTSFLNQYRGVLNNENLQTLEQTAKGIVAQNAEQKRLEAEQKAEADRQQAYQAIVTNIDYMLVDPSNFNDNGVLTEEGKNRMLQYIESNRSALGEQTYNAYKSQIESMKVYTEADRQKEEAEAQAEKDKRIITGQESIEYDGRYYQLQSQLDKNANQIKRNNDFKDKLKALGYSDPFDPNIPNGTTIKSNVDNRGSNDFNFWDDIGAFLLSPFGAGAWDSWGNWNEITMTYYNGNWYLSAEV
jgi:hypothetical protein|nr:MAG TPA: hypothetical protein [Caudoviricetes sp.]